MTNPVIVAELKRLAQAHGGELQPRAVVEAARSEDSPLHEQFDWNDSTAAHQWRLQQARQLIRTVVTYEQVGNGDKVPVRVFVSLTPDREHDDGGYRVSVDVMSDATLRGQLLSDARAEMIRFKEKYRQLQELAEVFSAIDNVTANELVRVG